MKLEAQYTTSTVANFCTWIETLSWRIFSGKHLINILADERYFRTKPLNSYQTCSIDTKVCQPEANSTHYRSSVPTVTLGKNDFTTVVLDGVGHPSIKHIYLRLNRPNSLHFLRSQISEANRRPATQEVVMIHALKCSFTRTQCSLETLYETNDYLLEIICEMVQNCILHQGLFLWSGPVIQNNGSFQFAPI